MCFSIDTLHGCCRWTLLDGQAQLGEGLEDVADVALQAFAIGFSTSCK